MLFSVSDSGSFLVSLANPPLVSLLFMRVGCGRTVTFSAEHGLAEFDLPQIDCSETEVSESCLQVNSLSFKCSLSPSCEFCWHLKRPLYFLSPLSSSGIKSFSHEIQR